MKREFKYYPEDFKELSVKVIHMDLIFDVHDSYTNVKLTIKLKSLKKIKELELNAKNLELLKIKCSFCEIAHNYDIKENKIFIKFNKLVSKNAEFSIFTETICRPTNNILEGLYYDVTPENCPPQQITQCQQWGFQRLVPCIDDMTAKCTYKTTIIADSRYTNMITNGDIVEPRKSLNNGRDKVVYENMKTPMAPYLFFLGVGTYSTFVREFEYPDGKKFTLEILAPLNAEKEMADKALDILFNSIMWIYLFTGPDKYKNIELKNKIYSLVLEREELKKQNKDLTEIRNKLKTLSKNLKLGYKYTGTVYREIGMQNSDFGGMENVGNTTITANKLLPFKEITDSAFEYMINVKVHEFYHNLNGSEVTGRSPFEIWLNEAVTVHVEREYLSELLSEEYIRLDTVLTLLMPGGTLDKDSGLASMPIEPDGFNDPNELITDVTYVKAPEFIRMIQLLMGKELFVKSLDLYHRTYKHGNASRKQWLECMEKVSKSKFQKMADIWLKKTSYPVLNVKTSYDEKTKKYTVNLVQQKNKENVVWEFPFDIALFDKKGNIIAKLLKRIKDQETKIIFDNIKEKPFFVSLNRGYSFYGKTKYDVSDQELYSQAKLDTDLINKYIAFYKLADKEKLNLLKNKKAKVSNSFIDLFYYLLSNTSLTDKTGSLLLTITQSVEDPEYEVKYHELYEAREKILLEIAKKYKKELLKMYNNSSKKVIKGPYVKKELSSIKNRQVKNLCLSLLARLDSPEVHNLIKKQYFLAEKRTDKIVAFSLYLRSSAKDRLILLEEEQKEAEKNLVKYESFLAAVGRNESPDALKIIKKVESSPSFKIEQTNCQRSLYNTFAENKRKSLLTEEGREFIQQTLIKLAKINEYTTILISKIFGKMDLLEEKDQVQVVKVILEILKTLDKDKTPSVYNTLARLLNNSKKAAQSYEKTYKEKIKF